MPTLTALLLLPLAFDSVQEGGGIYQTSIGTLTFNGMATFFDNSAYEVISDCSSFRLARGPRRMHAIA